jgi:hypothetical protein
VVAREPSDWDIAASIKAFLHPPAMTMDEAMASADPVNEVLLRLVKPPGEMTAPEHMFYAVMYFFGDTHNGGLEQTMTNDTGRFTDIVVEFADRYGNAELRWVMTEITALFPGRHVPLDRDERSDVISSLTSEDAEKLAQLTTRLAALDSTMRLGLLQLLNEHRKSFSLTRGDGDK